MNVANARMQTGDPSIDIQAVDAIHADGRSHNLLGQRLGRKGRDTRDRILAAVQRLLAGPAADTTLSLTAVAREASIGMTTLYLYFADMSALLLAVLEPLAGEVEALRERFDYHWPDQSLEAACDDFLCAHHLFWARHSRLLHLRNSFADSGDQRMLEARRAMSQPIMACLTRQMRSPDVSGGAQFWSYTVVLLTMLERMATITTDDAFALALRTSKGGGRDAFVRETLRAQGRIIALTIRECR